MSDWSTCKNILCIRPDNMGDVLMSSPAFRALKQSFNATITLLTSPMGAGMATYLSEVDEVIIFDIPWVRREQPAGQDFTNLLEQLRARQFDAAVIFTVYSQNPLPSAMIAFLAGIPRRLAYCRENPYELLTDWVPDPEPYRLIKLQVRRDLNLVQAIGATTFNDRLSLHVTTDKWPGVQEKLGRSGVSLDRPWMIIHPGVSEKKREYPAAQWVSAARDIIRVTSAQLVITGTTGEKQLADELAAAIGPGAVSTAGLFSLHEFILLISHASLLVSVNTVAPHIAAAVNTPVIVLYALTNPQHFPWHGTGKVLLYEVEKSLRSKNEVIRYVQDYVIPASRYEVMPEHIVDAVINVCGAAPGQPLIPEMMALRGMPV